MFCHIQLVTQRAAGSAVGGRLKGLSKAAAHKAIIAEQLYKDGELSISEMCGQLSISKSTFYKYLRQRGVELQK